MDTKHSRASSPMPIPGRGGRSPAVKGSSTDTQASAGLLKNRLQLVKSKREGRFEIVPIPENLSFDKGFFLFIRAIQLLTSSTEDVVVVGVAGPSGAGKTVFCEKIRTFIPGVVSISMDMYNDASKLVDSNFDDPRLSDYELLEQNLRDLRAGKSADIPIYDFKSSTRVGFRTQEPPSSRVVIIEGIYALSQRLQPLLDLRVSVTGGVHMDLVKRVMRDINRSGQNPEAIVQQISETVYPMYKAFIEPDLQTAHIKIVNTFNPFSGLQTPTYILKSDKDINEAEAVETLKSMCGSPTDEVKLTKQASQETVDIYLLPPGEDPETCQTWLRMRNREGRYSLMFEEWVTEGNFIISPRITFGVNVRILGGLMALGYEIGTLLQRSSTVYGVTCEHLHGEQLTLKFDRIEQFSDRVYVQVQGKNRAEVERLGEKLGLEGSYIPRSYIEQVQLEKLTQEFQTGLMEELTSRLNLQVDLCSPGHPTPIGTPERSMIRTPNFSEPGSSNGMSKTEGFDMEPQLLSKSNAPSHRVSRQASKLSETSEVCSPSHLADDRRRLIGTRSLRPDSPRWRSVDLRDPNQFEDLAFASEKLEVHLATLTRTQSELVKQMERMNSLLSEREHPFAEELSSHGLAPRRWTDGTLLLVAGASIMGAVMCTATLFRALGKGK